MGLHVPASQQEDTHIHTNTHANATGLQSWPAWLRRDFLGERRGRKGKGYANAFFSSPRGAAAFGCSIEPLGPIRSALLVLALSHNVEHLLCTKRFVRCFA